MNTEADEKTVLEVHPVMFRNAPAAFILCVLCIALFGLGLVFLGIWWLFTKASMLTVTNKRTVQRRGLISKHTTEVVHRDVRNIQVSQSVFQRLFGVGNIGISSAGQSEVEIQFNGLREPEGVKALIDKYRNL